MTHCNNDPCESEATYKFRTWDGTEFRLCAACKVAFEWGQARSLVTCIPIEDDFDEEEE